MKVVILRGVSGSGKSTFVERLRSTTRAVSVVNADRHFMEHGHYRFSPTRLPEVHAACLREYVASLAPIGAPGLPELLVVDNTNTTLVQVAPYVALAQAYGAEVEIIQFDISPEVAHGRSTHEVPLHTIKRQARQLEDSLANWPRHWPYPEVRGQDN